MKNSWVAFGVGLLFAFGLGLSGMTRPEKVIGFLDLFGAWDPSLMFVMAGAIGVHFFAYRAVRRLKSPVLAARWQVPQKTEITASLIGGSVLFGIGWGLAGLCPGPALTSLAHGEASTWIFVIAMIAGMFAFKGADRIFRFNR